MIRSLSAFTIGCLFPCLLSGCALQETCLTCKSEPVMIGWVTISGTTVPSTTTPVDENGKSLADCLIDSRINDVLSMQLRTKAPELSTDSFRKLTQADIARLTVTLQSLETSKAPVDQYAGMFTEVSALQLTLQDLPLNSWAEGFPHYAFDGRVSSDQDRSQLRFQLESLEDQNVFREAVRAFEILKTTNSPDKATESSLNFLSTLARDGKFRVGDDQKARAWSYKVIRDFEKSKSARIAGAADAVDAASWTTAVLSTLTDDYNSLAKDSSTVAANTGADSLPAESIFVIVEQRKQPITVLPLEDVFNSPLGSLWLFPGDHISLMRLTDIFFLNGHQGDKRIGVTGLVAQKGILKTDVNRLNQLLGEIDSTIDLRTNLIVVNYPIGKKVAKLFVPYTSSAVAQSSNRIEQLYGCIGLTDGTVVTMDHTDVTPTLKRSRLLMQQAAEARVSQTQLCSLKPDQRPVNAVPAKAKSQKRLPQIPVVSDACTAAQKTGKDSWAIAESWWQDFGFGR
jgi:hypothetical protein